MGKDFNSKPKTEIKKETAYKTVAKNKRAFFDYEILERTEAGLVLSGSEVKSAALGNVSLTDTFCHIYEGELYLKNCHFTPYEKGSFFNPEARRDRKLLLHKSELRRLYGKVKEKGLTLIPLSLYFKGRLLKAEIGLAQGKKQHDKRDVIRQKDLDRDAERQIKEWKR